ncbi:MAG: DUF2797 domain-containing protein [Arthrobacter sp.]|uniref:DUF2797 domain-containing protein n=1 Tax=Arthrobacter sp. TaxID=1667 RepID=UPI003471EAB6
MSEQPRASPGSLLCHGIAWPAADGPPRLALRALDGGAATGGAAGGGEAADVVLVPGTRLAFDVVPGKWCLGHTVVHGRDSRTSHACPGRSPAERGHQCGPCFAREDTRHMHDFHRSGIAPEGLRAYLAQEHWLYVASFAHGAAKIGTAAAGGKWRRLAEQGAVAGSYVALAADGRAVRVLEDLVTRELRLGQSVRSAAKAAGLAAGPGAAHDAGSLAEAHAGRAASVRRLLDSAPEAAAVPFRPVDERWDPPAAATALLAGWDAGRVRPYPGSLASGSHGFTVDSVSGQVLGVRLRGSDELFAVDAGALKGRRLTRGEGATEAPAVQDALF